MTDAISIRGALVTYGGVRAVNGVDLDVPEGSIWGLVGPNGSGKSSLLSAVSRFTPLKSGTLTFFGEDYTNWRPDQIAAHGLSRTFQAVKLLNSMTVLQNVMLGGGAPVKSAFRSLLANLVLDIPGRRERELRMAAQAALERTGMAAQARSFPDALSYGAQRRVEIARAICGQPRVLLLDEPTAGMTRAERKEIGVLLRDLRAEGLTILVVEHDMTWMQEICDRMTVLDMGSVIASGHPADVVAVPRVREAYLGQAAESVSHD